MNTYDVITAALPLTIRAVELQDPVVVLIGDRWSLTLMCPWYLDTPGRSVSWESQDLDDEVGDLVGQEIVQVSAGPDVIDPTFHLSGGMTPTVRADSDVDPWTLILPELVVTGRKRS